jgi:hypothetical protein
MTKYRKVLLESMWRSGSANFSALLVFSTPISERPEAEGRPPDFGESKRASDSCSRPGRTA